MFRLDKKAPILLLCPHPDDEIGCSGLISKLIEEGHPVHYCYFSTCEESTINLGFNPQQLLEEMRQSCAILGIPNNNIIGCEIPARNFPEHRQAILELMVKMRAGINPQLVLTPCSYDLHQDHTIVAEEAVRAFKHCNILGYEFIWNSLKSDLSLFVRLEKRHLDAKLKSWECYKTQKSRAYHGPQILEALARIRGLMANCEFAEAFEVRRIIL
jgi:LmbE family N-acetylglucosaminyl deacetylase